MYDLTARSDIYNPSSHPIPGYLTVENQSKTPHNTNKPSQRTESNPDSVSSSSRSSPNTTSGRLWRPPTVSRVIALNERETHTRRTGPRKYVTGGGIVRGRRGSTHDSRTFFFSRVRLRGREDVGNNQASTQQAAPHRQHTVPCLSLALVSRRCHHLAWLPSCPQLLLLRLT